MRSLPTPAKISRPRLSRIVARGRLFDILDQASKKSVIWVTGPGGSGKTTLVSSWLDARKQSCLWYQVDAGDGDLAGFFYYLGLAAQKAAPRYKKSLPLFTPEYHQGLPIFTRRYFEELFRRLKPPAILVFDNYQDAPENSGLHDMMAHALDTIPEWANVIVLSRTPPSAAYSRLLANNHIALLGWEDIRFTREESQNLLDTLGSGQQTIQALDLLHGKTEGWVAGLVLLMAHMKTGISAHTLEHLPQREVFDYFASEIFNKADPDVQEVLLKTAFLLRVEAMAAKKLTGIASTGKILERLSRDHYFTQKYEQAYQYHPLFREFLLSRAKATLSPSEVSKIQISAAALLVQAEQIEVAANLYIEAADWDSSMRLILGQAPLLIAQGRSKTLAGWLTALPQEQINGSSWALYWLGICRMPFDPGESRGYLEKAFDLFHIQMDMSGVYLAWASIIDTFLYQWSDFLPVDRWVAVIEKLLTEHPGFPSPEIEARVAAGMLNALTWRQPHRADLPLWAERVRQIVLNHPSVQLRIMLGSYLMIYYLWIGDFAKSGLLMEALRPVIGLKENDPLTQQNWHVMEAMHAWFTADNLACKEAIAKGLKSAEDSGVHLLNLYLLGQGVYSGISLGDPPTAISCLEKMSVINSPRVMDKSFYQYQASSVAWLHGDLKKAVEQGRLAVQFAEATGCPLSHALCLIELAVTLFEDGQHEEAHLQLVKGSEVGGGMNLIRYMHALHAARFAFDQGEDERGLAALQQGLALGAQQGYVNIPRWNVRTMPSLCAKALEHGIETDYVHKLIKLRGLTPPDSVTNLDAWPWPVRIYTLGRFEIVRDGKPVEFSGKVQQKPIELLKALIAFGGADVGYEPLVTALWPDAEGDKAYQSFEATLHRLRKLIGVETAIQRVGGCISLDPKYCWVDAMAFERSADAAHDPQCTPEMVMRLDSIAVSMYRGSFLAGDMEKIWAITPRERLNNKYVRLIKKAGEALERAGRLEQAIEYYHKALDVNQVAEEFYQCLMTCYHRLDRPAEAIAVYKQCRRVLFAAIGIEPSSKTEGIYSTLISATG